MVTLVSRFQLRWFFTQHVVLNFYYRFKRGMWVISKTLKFVEPWWVSWAVCVGAGETLPAKIKSEHRYRVMKIGSKGIHCTQRNSGSKMSQSCASSSDISLKVCGCGEKLLLLNATIVKNKGRLFWRCRNWVVSDKFHIYWASSISFHVLMVLFFCSQILIVISLNGLMKRNLNLKGTNLNFKTMVEQE